MIPALRAVYGDRILAFDHPTVSVGPQENAQQFLSRVPPDLPFTFDVLVHSRGGLVARCVAGGAGLDPQQVTFRKVVFVGTPNDGTEIAAPGLIGQLVDRMTSFLHFVPPVGPPGTVAAVLTSVLEVVKVFGQGIEGGMPGLTDMQPGSALLTTLNKPATSPTPPSAPSAVSYFEIDADYRPDGSLRWLMRGFDDVEDDAVFAKGRQRRRSSERRGRRNSTQCGRDRARTRISGTRDLRVALPGRSRLALHLFRAGRDPRAPTRLAPQLVVR